MTEHVVQPGEHLAGIAAAHGFQSIRPIWEHPANAALREKRKNPNVLFPGDRLEIPEREERVESAATDKKHRFERAAQGLELRVKVLDQGRDPIEGECSLVVGSSATAMPQEKDIYQGPLDPRVTEARLDFPVSPAEKHRPEIPISVGDLDPIEELSGQQQRLNNLGYFAGFRKTQAVDPKGVDLQLKWAVEEFQADHPPLTVDGVLGDQTRRKLRETYGC